MSNNAVPGPEAQMPRVSHWRNAVFVLLVLILGSALAVVHSAHRSRQMFVRLESIGGEENGLQEEWRQLLLERSALAAHARVESIARARLGMHPLGDRAQVMLR